MKNPEPTVLVPLMGGEWLALSRAAFDEARRAARCEGFGANAAQIARAEAEPLLDAEGLALALSLPVSWVEQAARDGRIPCVRAGRWIRFSRIAVIAGLEAAQ